MQAANSRLRPERLCELAAAVTSIASPTGDEARLAEYLADVAGRSGIDAEVQWLDETQANAVGRLSGDGTGGDLLLYAPIDTLTVGTEAADVPWVGPSLRADMVPSATVDGPYVVGLGASNPKGHAACVVAAAEAIAEADLPLHGSVLVGFGAGGMPTNARDDVGRRNGGHGIGCAHLLEHGPRPDAAVVAKPGWTVSWEEVGLTWFDVTAHGTHTYVGSRHRLPYRNPIVDAATIITELEAWFETYTARHTEGTVAPQAIIAAIEGGWWRMAAVTPAACRLRVDVRTAPSSEPADIASEFGAAIDQIRARHDHLEIVWEQTLAIPGSSTAVDSFVVEAAVEAWEDAEHRPHEVITGNAGATDANILRHHGIPTARIGMPKVADLDVEVDFALGMNTVDVREMEILTRLLVRTAVNYCSRHARGGDRVSSIVLGVGASHSTLMNTHWHEVAGEERALRFREALGVARDAVAAAAPDAVVIVGSNHFRGLWLDLMPAFTLGVGDCTMSGESGTPAGPVPVDVELARHVCRAVVEAEFDLAFSSSLQIDHGISHAVQYLLAGIEVPIVPLVVNVFAPPLPSLRRCDALGAQLVDAIESDGAAKRVVAIASGGLSHTLPFPRWDAPASDDDRFLVEAFTDGRTRWRELDGRRREIIRAAPPGLHEDFDRALLDLVDRGQLASLVALSDEELEVRAGNGAHEIRTWLVMAGMCRHAPGRTLAYSAMPEWLTGMGIAIIEPDDEEHR